MKKSLINLISVTSLSLVAAAPLLTCCNKTVINKKVHILALNDIHGEIPGYGDDYFEQRQTYAGAIRIADEMQKIVEESDDSIILSGGDNNSSGKFSACSKGATMYPVLSAMDIRYSAVGNHAWAWGDQNLQDEVYDKAGRTDKTEGKYFVTANVITDNSRGVESTYEWETDITKPKFLSDFNDWVQLQPTWSNPYKLVDLAGHKICIIGLTTTETPSTGNREELSNYGFMHYNPAIHYAKYKCKTDMPNEYNQIESFILLTHCGCEFDGAWLHGEAQQIANEVDTRIDAVLAGHTHADVCAKIYNNKINRPIIITQTKEKMQSFADLEFVFDDSKPVGFRFKEIKPRIITPDIDTSSFEAAKKQIDDIVAKPRNKVVENVCKVYADQKEQAKVHLSNEVGTTTNGLTYLQANNKKQYLYPEDIEPMTHAGILVEQAGAFAAKAEIEGFNEYYEKQKFTSDKYKKANISYIANVSIGKGITKPASKSKVTLNNLYDLYQYDDFAVTTSLTYFQLEQLVRYMFTGKETHSESDLCTDEYQLTPSSSPTMIPNLKFPFGPNQFYGFAFDTKSVISDKQFRRYDYDDGGEHAAPSLLVYDPDVSTCDINNPKTWLGKEHWMNEDGTAKKYITLVMNVFTFENGNNQNMMIKMFGDYNSTENPPPIQTKYFHSMDVRDLARLYFDKLQSAGTDIELSDDICYMLTHIGA